ncbi:hypothetical protein PMAYCL1PPCAC_05189 [Pristionchus mayeri]|uniref:Uncharacterized protein n=1 Tax=Pristionchus mayeri TaxID=1317129 RepID=A0AAN4Z8C0_9BILA|nr:hypothetical protein PMAYCL1PPCAC_05189 [Pristionchus mayeri]
MDRTMFPNSRMPFSVHGNIPIIDNIVVKYKFNWMCATILLLQNGYHLSDDEVNAKAKRIMTRINKGRRNEESKRKTKAERNKAAPRT